MTATVTVFSPLGDTLVYGPPGIGKTQCVALAALDRWNGPALLCTDTSDGQGIVAQRIQIGTPIDPLTPNTVGRYILYGLRAGTDEQQRAAALLHCVLPQVQGWSARSATQPLVVLEDSWALSAPVVEMALDEAATPVPRVVVLAQSKSHLRDRLGDELFGRLAKRCAFTLDFHAAERLGASGFGAVAVTHETGGMTTTKAIHFTPFFAMKGGA